MKPRLNNKPAQILVVLAIIQIAYIAIIIYVLAITLLPKAEMKTSQVPTKVLTTVIPSVCYKDLKVYRPEESYQENHKYCACNNNGNFDCQDMHLQAIYISTNKTYSPKFLKTDYYTTDNTNIFEIKSYLYDKDGNSNEVATDNAGINYQRDRIFTIPSAISGNIINILVAQTNEAWIIGLTRSADETLSNEIYLVDSNPTKIWEKTSMGTFQNMSVLNGYYVEFTISDCYACAPIVVPNSTYVLNVQTRKYLSLGLAGNINVNLSNKKLNYQALQEMPLPCTDPAVDDFSCDPSTNTGKGYKPSGKTITKVLP